MTCPVCQADNDSNAAACRSCGASLPASAATGPTAVIVTVDLSPGTLFHGRYEILGPLGRGGMGMVYRARDKTLDEIVAIKVLRPDFAQDPTMAARFRSEIKLARKVRHRNVCAIHDYGEEKGLLYISMELVEGIDLKRLLREKGGLRFEEAFDISVQIAEGLQAVHDAGIIHRDLKSPNIMVDPQKVARLMDFGIAKRQEGGGASTATGQILGTPEYMSPEQAQGQHVDFRSDVYALGVVIYEIFTGDVPFRGETPISTILKHLHDPPPIDAARVPDSLRPVLKSALAKDPAGRYPTARALADALRAARATGRREHEVPTAVLEAPTLAHPSMAAKGSNPWVIAAPAMVIAVIAVALRMNSGSGSVGPAAPSPTPSLQAAFSPTKEPSPPREPAPTPSAPPVSPPVVASAEPASRLPPRRPTPARPTGAPTPAPTPVFTNPVSGVTSTPNTTIAPPPTVPAAAPQPVTPTPALEPGQLQFGVKPWAEIVVDGRVIGTTPLDKLTLEAGAHVVLLRHPAYEELRRTIVINPGATVKLNVDLTREGTPKR